MRVFTQPVMWFYESFYSTGSICLLINGSWVVGMLQFSPYLLCLIFSFNWHQDRTCKQLCSPNVPSWLSLPTAAGAPCPCDARAQSSHLLLMIMLASCRLNRMNYLAWKNILQFLLRKDWHEIWENEDWNCEDAIMMQATMRIWLVSWYILLLLVWYWLIWSILSSSVCMLLACLILKLFAASCVISYLSSHGCGLLYTPFLLVSN